MKCTNDTCLLEDLAAHDAAVREDERKKWEEACRLAQISYDKERDALLAAINGKSQRIAEILKENDDWKIRYAQASSGRQMFMEERDALRIQVEDLLAERSTVRAAAIDDVAALLKKIPCGAFSMLEVVEKVKRLKEE